MGSSGQEPPNQHLQKGAWFSGYPCQSEALASYLLPTEHPPIAPFLWMALELDL